MKRLQSNFVNMAAALTLIALVAAAALASVHDVTKEPIEAAKKAKKEQAISKVLPKYTRVDSTGVNGITVYQAYNGHEFVGSAIETSEQGFGGAIKLMVGFDAQGNIVSYEVLEQTETPGLGTKIVDWFKTDKNRQNICGKNPQNTKLTVSKDGGEVDAITAATISSRAFLKAVNKAYAAFARDVEYNDVASGASVQSNEHVELGTDTRDVQSGASAQETHHAVIEPETEPEVEPENTDSL